MKKVRIGIMILFVSISLMACGLKTETNNGTEEVVTDEQQKETKQTINQVQIIEIEK